jgi:hypothetical protein
VAVVRLVKSSDVVKWIVEIEHIGVGSADSHIATRSHVAFQIVKDIAWIVYVFEDVLEGYKLIGAVEDGGVVKVV